MSPVTTAFDPKPMRVRNIFICSDVVFCASSRMMKASFRVRPRMKAIGRHLDDAPLEQLRRPLVAEDVVERVVERPQVRVDLFDEVARAGTRAVSPASTAGRASTIRLTFFSSSAAAAIATAR